MINSAIFPAPKCSYDLSRNDRRTMVHVPRPDGTFTIAYVIENVASTARGSHFVIYAHPNAVDIGMMYDDLAYFCRKTGTHGMLFEYRGYGLNGGKPGEEELNLDIEAAFNFAVRVLGIPQEQIVLYGRSIGTGPTSQLAARLDGSSDARRPPAMLILEAPFTSIKECVKTLVQKYASALGGFASSFVANRFRTVDVIGKVVCPVVIVHGKKDDIVTYDHAERLVAAATAAGKTNLTLRTVADAGHNDLPLSETIEGFLDCVRGGDGSASWPRITFSIPEHFVSSRSLAATAVAAGMFRRELFQNVLGPVPRDTLRSRRALAKVMTLSCISFIHAAAFAWQQRDNRWRWDHARKMAASPASPGVYLMSGAVTVVSSVASVAQQLASGARNVATGTPSSAVASSSSEPSAATPAHSPSTTTTATWHSYKPEVTELQHLEACLAVWGSPFGIYALPRAPKRGGSGAAAIRLMAFGCILRGDESIEGDGADPDADSAEGLQTAVVAARNAFDDILALMRRSHSATNGKLDGDLTGRLAAARVPLLQFDTPRGLTGRRDGSFVKELQRGMTSLLPTNEHLLVVDWLAGESPTSLTATALSIETCDRLQLLCERLVASLSDEHWGLVNAVLDHADTLADGALFSPEVNEIIAEGAFVDGQQRSTTGTELETKGDAQLLLSSASATLDGVSRDGQRGTDPTWESCVLAERFIAKHGKNTHLGSPAPPTCDVLISSVGVDDESSPASPSPVTRGRKSEDKDCAVS